MRPVPLSTNRKLFSKLARPCFAVAQRCHHAEAVLGHQHLGLTLQYGPEPLLLVGHLQDLGLGLVPAAAAMVTSG